MLEVLENIIHIFVNIVMHGFFWYSLVILILSITDSLKPTFIKVDATICNIISIAGIVYIVSVLLMYVLFHEVLFALIASPNGSQLLLWCVVLLYPLLLFIFSQLLRIDKMRNSMPFRGITAILFLFIY